MIKSVIEKGYFPKELPPLFTSSMLANIAESLISKMGALSQDSSSSKAISFTIPKTKNSRRNMCIPNPLHQLQLVNCICENWVDLCAFFEKSTISLTKPTYCTDSKRAIIAKSPFNEITRQRIIMSTASKYLLKTDISRFYSTIYTHSISWALHGKETAKINKNDKKLLGNILDFYVRNTKEQQTLGIHVGPDTSLVIAEIVGTAIDIMLKARITDLNGFRYIDDIYIYFEDLSMAEKSLSIINSVFSSSSLK